MSFYSICGGFQAMGLPHIVIHLYPCYFRVFHEINQPAIGLPPFQETFIWFHMVLCTHSVLGLKKYPLFSLYQFKGYPHIF